MNVLTMQQLLHHTRRNRDVISTALKASQAVAEIDPSNVNVPFELERYERQLTALMKVEAVLSQAV